jgi:hypothetical protein
MGCRIKAEQKTRRREENKNKKQNKKNAAVISCQLIFTHLTSVSPHLNSFLCSVLLHHFGSVLLVLFCC